jgi:hypothetical protein
MKRSRNGGRLHQSASIAELQSATNTPSNRANHIHTGQSLPALKAAIEAKEGGMPRNILSRNNMLGSIEIDDKKSKNLSIGKGLRPMSSTVRYNIIPCSSV